MNKCLCIVMLLLLATLQACTTGLIRESGVTVNTATDYPDGMPVTGGVIMIDFAAPIIPSTANTDSVDLEDTALGEPVTIDVSADESRITITPSEDLTCGNEYTLKLKSLIRYRDGTFLRAQQYNVRTVTCSPTLRSISPVDTGTAVSIDATIVAIFSKEMDISSFTADSVNLSSAGGEVPITFSYGDDNSTIVITPGISLDESTSYTITFSTAITAADEMPLPREITSTFRTEGLWIKSYGGADFEYMYSLAQLSNGYAVVGNTQSFGEGSNDFWLVNLDLDGTPNWQRAYGGAAADTAARIIETSDGDFVALGATGSFGAGGTDIWVAKFNADWEVLWWYAYGTAGAETACDIVETSDGGYAIAGLTNDGFFLQIWVLKISSDGSTIDLDKTYAIAGNNVGGGQIRQTADGGYIIVGYYSSPFGPDDQKAWIFKVDSTGAILWQNTYDLGVDRERVVSIQQTSDGGYIAGGYTDSVGFGDFDAWIFKINDADGSIAWQRVYGGANDDFANEVIITSDGGYIVAASTKSYGAGSLDAWLFKLSSAGAIEWQNTYGDANADILQFVSETDVGNYLLVGYTQLSDVAKRDGLVMKIDSIGGVSDTCGLIAPSTAGSAASAAVPAATAAIVGAAAATVTDIKDLMVETETTADTFDQCSSFE